MEKAYLGQQKPAEINGEMKSPEEMAKIIRARGRFEFACATARTFVFRGFVPLLTRRSARFCGQSCCAG